MAAGAKYSTVTEGRALRLGGTHPARVLVTGATGFSARYVIPILRSAGHEVFELARGIQPDAHRVACEIRDAAALRDALARIGPEYVVHLAGTPNLPDSSAELAFSVNVQGTVNLLEACGALPRKPAKIVLASSAYVYGNTGSEPADEGAPLKPTNEYGRSKLEMERAAGSWFGKLPIVILRPFNYTGVGHEQCFLVPKLVKLFRERGDDASFVDPNVVRDFSDVRWVARVYAQALGLPDSGRAINVCSGEGTPLGALVTTLERLTGHRIAKRPGGGPPAGPAQRMVGSPRSIHGLLGRSPFRLEETLEWMMRVPAGAAAG